jgi:hypothetical protein
VDDYLGLPVENFVTPAGIPLGSRDPASETVAYWVPEKNDAVGTMTFPDKDVRKVFGGIPAGKINPWSKLGEFRPDIVINGFHRSKGSRTVLPGNKKIKPVPLPTRKF